MLVTVCYAVENRLGSICKIPLPISRQPGIFFTCHPSDTTVLLVAEFTSHLPPMPDLHRVHAACLRCVTAHSATSHRSTRTFQDVVAYYSAGFTYSDRIAQHPLAHPNALSEQMHLSSQHSPTLSWYASPYTVCRQQPIYTTIEYACSAAGVVNPVPGLAV